MMPSDRALKLTVPGPWQSAVGAAIDHLAARLAIAPAAIAPTRVEEGGGADGRSLVVWLMARGRTWRYTADPSGASVAPDAAAGGSPPSA